MSGTCKFPVGLDDGLRLPARCSTRPCSAMCCDGDHNGYSRNANARNVESLHGAVLSLDQTMSRTMPRSLSHFVQRVCGTADQPATVLKFQEAYGRTPTEVRLLRHIRLR